MPFFSKDDFRGVPSSLARRRYRYYFTAADQLQPGSPPTWRLPANNLETLVIARLQQFLADRDAIRKILPGTNPSAAELMATLEKTAELAAVLGTNEGRTTLLRKLIREVRVQETSVALTLDRPMVLKRLGITAVKVGGPPLVVTATAVKIRRGQDVALVPADPKGSAQRADVKLLALLEQAQATRKAIIRHPEWSMHKAAVTVKQNRERLIQLVQLSFLSPEIVGAIHEGRHPATLTPRALLAAQLPIHWSEQKTALGFG